MKKKLSQYIFVLLLFPFLTGGLRADESVFNNFVNFMESLVIPPDAWIGEYTNLVPTLRKIFHDYDDTDTELSYSEVQAVVNPYITGQQVLDNQIGCGTHWADTDRPFANSSSLAELKGDAARVAFLGDSLTHFSGPNEFWDYYLGTKNFKTVNLGAAGSGSTQWREHFDRCEAEGNRLTLPTRSMMMIGGNDMHVWKSMLQPMWFLVPHRINSILYNVDKIIDHHKKGNDGEGDKGENPGGVARGRLFVVLGNIPAVSVDPTQSEILYSIYQSLDLISQPYVTNIWDQQPYTIEEDDTATYLYKKIVEAALPGIIDPIASELDPHYDTYKNHTWASRQMFEIQHKLQLLVVFRHFGSMAKGEEALASGNVDQNAMSVPYIHMWDFFTDKSATDRGCYWCANRDLWMKEKFGGTNYSISFNDGIHINHPYGYMTWAGRIKPTMDELNMSTLTREDSLPPPGEELGISSGCDDMCLIAMCFYFGICKT